MVKIESFLKSLNFIKDKMIWFTADQHFGHHRIIDYCNRPFKNVHEMDLKIIEKFNSVVGVKDTTYHLGDFSLKHSEHYLKQLNGNHCLIKGNHDHKNTSSFSWAKNVYQLKAYGKMFWLSHYAHRVWPQSHYGSIHLYGHSHNTIDDFENSMDIGVDTNNFKPYSIDQIINIFENKR